MENPFAYSHFVTGDSFCNREKEQKEMMKYIKGSQNVLLYSSRRYGKSSLIKQVFQVLENSKQNIGTMYIDLYGTVSERDFISKCYLSLQQLESNFEKMVKSLVNTAKNFRFNIGVDASTGSPSITPSFDAVKPEIILEELMNLLQSFSHKRKLVIALDEFQEIADYGEAGFEKRLRSYVQNHSNICYIFSSSRRHIITEMFNSNNRAFYKLADSLPIEKIATSHYISWIKKIFKQKPAKLTNDIITDIVERFENHPMVIQNFLFHLWEKIDHEKANSELINSLENEIILKRNPEFTILWDNLTVNQKKTLKLVALNDGKNLFNSDTLSQVGLKSASLVSKALSSLQKKEIISKNGIYIIQDIILKKWIMKII